MLQRLGHLEKRVAWGASSKVFTISLGLICSTKNGKIPSPTNKSLQMSGHFGKMKQVKRTKAHDLRVRCFFCMFLFGQFLIFSRTYPRYLTNINWTWMSLRHLDLPWRRHVASLNDFDPSWPCWGSNGVGWEICSVNFNLLVKVYQNHNCAWDSAQFGEDDHGFKHVGYNFHPFYREDSHFGEWCCSNGLKQKPR